MSTSAKSHIWLYVRMRTIEIESRKRKNQRGAVSVEAALLVPLFVLVMSVAAAGWRISWAHTQVAGAAQAAARAASLKGDAAQAHVTVIAIVQADLKTAGVHCSDIVIRDDVAAVAQLTGTSGVVSVGVQCTVRLGDLLVPGLPGSIVVNGQATEAIDTFSRRGR